MKTIFLLFMPLFIWAQCTYTLKLNFDVTKNQLEAQGSIYNSKRSVNLSFSNFDIQNKTTLKEAIQNGSNHLKFTYKLNSKNINENNIYLLNNWYPTTNELCQYNISHNLDQAFTSITEQTKKPIAHATFLASKNYHKQSTKYKEITISTYFFKQNKTLSKKYFDKTIEYIKLYENLIAPYPYKVFNIVENHQITGYSMPTYTLIGSYLLNKDYLLNRSLGHEFLHQYFGNSVFNDHTKGNYSEGLTTYLSDNYYEKLKGKELIQKQQSLLFFETFATKDFPAKDFVYRKDKNSMAIGYTKVAFIFSMLENKLGKETFFEILKKFYTTYAFKVANLDTLQNFFQEHSKEDLTTFFNQWFNQKGIIDFNVSDFKKGYEHNQFFIAFKLTQKNNFTFKLPINIKTYEGEEKQYIRINQKEQNIKVYTKSEPYFITLDKNYELFRKLFTKEVPIHIGKILNKPLLLVVDEKNKNKYEGLSKAFKKATFIESKKLTFEQLKQNHVIFLDKTNSLLKHFLPRLEQPKKSSYLKLIRNTYNAQKYVGVLHANKQLPRSFYLLNHYSYFQEIIIKDKKVEKVYGKTAFGYSHKFNHKPIISQVSKPIYLNQINEKLKNSKVIYATESHTNFNHHLNQLRIIKQLYKHNKNLVIGMEMFQMPYQKALDTYIQKKSDLKTFLKDSNYFSTWRYNYNLYKPIMDFARENSIKIVALNISRDVIKEVSNKGILNFKGKDKLPKKIDQSNIQYKNDLKDIFGQHTSKKSKSNNNRQDYFYQSQLIWDEIMAQNISSYIMQHPNAQMVVLVGSGHVEKHYGIPNRVYADTKLPFSVVLNDKQEGMDNDIIIHNNEEIKIASALKLGVFLKNDKELLVLDIQKDSLGEKLGILKQDTILKLNEDTVNNISDLKLALYFVKEPSSTSVTVLRNKKEKILKINSK